MRLAALVIVVLCALPAQAEQITVFAASSLKTALDRIAGDHEAATGDEVAISYGGSSVLARQIVAGAPADLFISASQPWMDEVAASGRIAQDGRRDLLANRLVLIGYGRVQPLKDWPDVFALTLGRHKLAMALVDSVPAGQYGKQALTSLGDWDSVTPQVVQADNARAALALVATGAAQYGITYASDAMAEPRVSLLWTFPEDSHDPITYPAALLSDSPAAARFLDALGGDAARAVFAQNGFRPLP